MMDMIDALTGLPGRPYFNDQLAREWGRAIRDTSQIGLLIIDIDRFKAYNEVYGREQGDALVRAISGALRHTFRRPADFLARYDGGKFAVLMPGTDPEGTLEVAERIRAGVVEMVIPYRDGSPTCATVSIGAASELPIINLPTAEFLAKAERALFDAKKAGGNRVCAYRNELDAAQFTMGMM